MEPQAALHCIHLYSPQPLEAARFYSSTYGLSMEPVADGYLCRGPGRELRLSQGAANQLCYAHYALAGAGAWQAFAARVQGLQNTLRDTDFVNSFTIPAISRLTTQRFS